MRRLLCVLTRRHGWSISTHSYSLIEGDLFCGRCGRCTSQAVLSVVDRIRQYAP